MELTDHFVYIVTSSYYDYNQHGDYYEGVFRAPPTSEQLSELLEINKLYSDELQERGLLRIGGITYEITREVLL